MQTPPGQSKKTQIGPRTRRRNYWPITFARTSFKGQAVTYLLEAAENAAKRYANETAVYHYRHVLSLIETEPAKYSSNYFPGTNWLRAISKAVR